jgi:hypothetical protein
VRRQIATYASGIGLALVSILVFLEFFRAGQVIPAIVEGVLVPASVVYEWRRAKRGEGDATTAVLRMVPIVALALLGISAAFTGPW